MLDNFFYFTPRARLMNSMHFRIPEYSFGSAVPNTRIPVQGKWYSLTFVATMNK